VYPMVSVQRAAGMIKGIIENGLHPKISVKVEGNFASKEFSALVDTGFDSDMALHIREASNLRPQHGFGAIAT